MKSLFGALLLIVATIYPAISQETRTVDFSAQILDLANKPVPDPALWPADPATGQPDLKINPATVPALTLGSVAVGALNQPESNLTVSQLFHRGELASRVAAGGKMPISSEDLALIESLLPKYGSPLVIFRVMRLFGEPDPK